LLAIGSGNNITPDRPEAQVSTADAAPFHRRFGAAFDPNSLVFVSFCEAMDPVFSSQSTSADGIEACGKSAK